MGPEPSENPLDIQWGKQEQLFTSMIFINFFLVKFIFLMIIMVDLFIDAWQKPFIFQICRLKDSWNHLSKNSQAKIVFLQQQQKSPKK